jgi:hypothetical protein
MKEGDLDGPNNLDPHSESYQPGADGVFHRDDDMDRLTLAGHQNSTNATTGHQARATDD